MKKFLYSVIFLFLTVLFPTQETLGQTAQKPLHLIPQPKEIAWGNGTFTFAPGMKIFVTRPSDSTLIFAVNQLLQEAKQDMNLSLRYSPKVRKASVLAGLPGQSKKLDKQAASLMKKLKSCGSEGYVLQISPKKIILLANTNDGIFYGIQTLRQLIRANRKGNSLPALTIVDKPALRFRGWQDDISRGPIPTLAFLKKEIRNMAFFKMNVFTLYTENVFRLKSHPDLAPRDGITAAEIKELSAYARKYHVNLIGNFQAFGHFRKILEKPEYKHLAETPSVISPAFPETYKLLGDILKEIASAYSSKYFMINCDEVFGLGSGPAKTMVDTMGLAGVYAYHINKLVQILKPFHKTILMWGDIARDYPQIISKLPKNIIVLPWAYQAAPSFKNEIEPFKKSGMPFWVAPGVSCWGQIFPRLSTAEVNISHFVRDGKAMGADGMLNTTWDDDGENLFSMNWLPLAWGAACAWNPVMSKNDTAINRRYRVFTQSFDPLFYGSDAGVTQNMLKLDHLHKNPVAGGLTDHAFWKPLFAKINTRRPETYLLYADSLKKETTQLIQYFKKAKEKAVRNKANIDYLIFAAERVRFLSEKNKLRCDLTCPAERKQLTQSGLKETLDTLENQLTSLKQTYTMLWHRENRPYWLNRNLAKYDRLEKALQAVPYHVFIQADTDYFAPVRRVRLQGLFPDSKILYTTGNTLSDTSWRMYQNPIQIKQTDTLKARMAPAASHHPVFRKVIRIYNGPVAHITLKYPFFERYKARGLISLVDGIRGTKNFRDGRWLGFQKTDFDVEITLKNPLDADTVSITFLQSMRSWILFPEWVSCSVSKDGKKYFSAGKKYNTISWHRAGSWIQTFSFPIQQKDIRFIRIHAKNVGKLPEWHPAAGGKAWLFTDEISIKTERSSKP